MYNLYSKSKSELFGFERGVDGARDRTQQQLTQKNNGARLCRWKPLKNKAKLPFLVYIKWMFYYLTVPQLLGAPFYL